MDGVCETVVVTTKNGPVRVNKSDYDADPKAYTLASETKQKDNATQTVNTAGVGGEIPPVQPGFVIPPAPSAPKIGEDGKDAVAPVAPSPNQRFVTKDGKKFYVTDGGGNRVAIDGIDPKGYATELEAWTAIGALPR